MSFGFFHGFAPIKQPATCGPLITEAAGITDDNLFTVLCSHNHLSFLSYSIISWKNLSGKSCVIHGLAQKCSLVPKCHILLSHSNSLFIMMELHLHLRFTSGWISVGSVPSPLDDPQGRVGRVSFLSYSIISWKNLSGKSCVIHGLAQKCSLVPKCHILLSHSNSLFIMMELHLHLRFTSGWISVGSVPSPLDDPHSEATQPRGDPDLQVLNSGVQSITLGRRPQFFPETSTNPTR